MDHFNTSAGSASEPTAPAAPDNPYFTSGNPGLGVPATVPGPYWFHMISEEILNVITAAGITPDHEDLTQLQTAILSLITAAIPDAPSDASETVKGIAEIATQPEVNSGADDFKFITPLKFKNGVNVFGANNFGSVRLNTANGFGSTNTKIRRFTNVVANVGADITYADSATLGGSFTINTAGVYAVSFSEGVNAANRIGLSLNSNQLTTDIQAISIGNILANTTTPTANVESNVCWTGYLQAGDVVRAHTQGNPQGGTAQSSFTIARVA